MRGMTRISIAAALATLVAAIMGPAAAGPPNRQIKAEFFTGTSQLVSQVCLVTGSTGNILHLRITKVSKQGPHVRSADATPSGATLTAVANPSSSTGPWSSALSGNTVELDSGGGAGQLKQNDWVQVGLTLNASSTPGTYEWAVTAAGPGSSGTTGNAGYTLASPAPSIVVANTCPGDGGGTTTQSGAGTPCTSPTLTGGAGDTLLIGTPGNDVILDLLGNNHVEGRGGNDIVCTGPGNDVVLTLGGSDIAFDQGGTNLIRTAAGPDTITTGRGNSRIAAGRGADKVSAGTGRNNIRLGKGRDRSTSDSGNDKVKAGAGKDIVRAGDGRNRVGGGRGNDRLRAGSGRDRLNGAAGRDICRADGGRNVFRNCELARGNGA